MAVLGSVLNLAHLLTALEQEVSSRLASILNPEGCTVEQWRVLCLLADGQGHTMSEVARFAQVPAPTLTKLVDRLVAENLVYRRVDSEDRRRVRVFLTRRGDRLYSRLSELAQIEFRTVAGPETTDQLVELLGRLRGQL